jgi:predicted nuclease with TOPRIM domain
MSSNSDGHSSDIQQLKSDLAAAQEKLSRMSARESRLAELLKCTPERLEHDLRNVLNELQLLRTIFESEEKKK